MFARLTSFALPLFLLAACGGAVLGQGKAVQKLYVTNSAGHDVTVIDVAGNKVLGRNEVGPNPHGIATPEAQDVITVTIEGGKKGELVWIDPVTDKITRRMPIGPGP